MSESTKVILIRHGETEWNLSGRWQGHADSPLSPRGVSQAIALGERMSTESLDHFYTSDLERAQHTARLIGEPSGWLANPLESLRERELGDMRRGPARSQHGSQAPNSQALLPYLLHVGNGQSEGRKAKRPSSSAKTAQGRITSSSTADAHML